MQWMNECKGYLFYSIGSVVFCKNENVICYIQWIIVTLLGSHDWEDEQVKRMCISPKINFVNIFVIKLNT